MKPSECQSNHYDVPMKEIETLPASQAVKVRHRCAACAYELGYKHASDERKRLREENAAMREELADLKKFVESMKGIIA